MTLYFSGIGDLATANLLAQSNNSKVVVDPHDLPNVESGQFSIGLDSGAYRAFKAGQVLNPQEFLDRHLAMTSQRNIFDWVIMPDVIGDPDATWRNWEIVKTQGSFVPVWQWGSPQGLLDEFLKQAPLVAIGGLVPHMRDKVKTTKKTKEQLKDRDAVLEQLFALATAHPGRIHALGLCWLKAILRLRHVLASADTSAWLDAARYGVVIFRNTKTGHLSRCPASIIPEFRGMDRKQRCIYSAREMSLAVAA